MLPHSHAVHTRDSRGLRIAYTEAPVWERSLLCRHGFQVCQLLRHQQKLQNQQHHSTDALSGCSWKHVREVWSRIYWEASQWVPLVQRCRQDGARSRNWLVSRCPLVWGLRMQGRKQTCFTTSTLCMMSPRFTQSTPSRWNSTIECRKEKKSTSCLVIWTVWNLLCVKWLYITVHGFCRVFVWFWYYVFNLKKF